MPKRMRIQPYRNLWMAAASVLTRLRVLNQFVTLPPHSPDPPTKPTAAQRWRRVRVTMRALSQFAQFGHCRVCRTPLKGTVSFVCESCRGTYDPDSSLGKLERRASLGGGF